MIGRYLAKWTFVHIIESALKDRVHCGIINDALSVTYINKIDVLKEVYQNKLCKLSLMKTAIYM